MSIVSYIDKSGWRTKLTAFCWAVTAALMPFAVIASVLTTEPVIPLIIPALAAFVFPLLFILVIKPVLKGGLVLGDWMWGTFGVVIMFDEENGKFKRPMTFGEALALGVTVSVVGSYYVGLVVGTLAITGVIPLSAAGITYSIVLGLSFSMAALAYIDSQP